jgi:hypothetical protein
LQEPEHAAEQKPCDSVPDEEGEAIVCGIHKNMTCNFTGIASFMFFDWVTN